MQKKELTSKTIRFRRWIRKGYAAFSSLGICVTIGCLRKSVTECALLKQSSLQALQPGKEQEDVRPGEQDDSPSPESLVLLTTSIHLQDVFNNHTARTAIPAVSALYSINSSIAVWNLSGCSIRLFFYPHSL